MKKQILTLVLLAFSTILLAQNPPTPSDGPLTPVLPSQSQNFYLGISSGLNYGGLFAFTGELNLVNNLSLAGSLGVGTWGFKTGVDLRLYKDYARGMYFVGGFSRSSGIPEIEIDIETQSTTGSTEKVTMELFATNNINLGIGYAWRIGDRVRILLEGGYAVNISGGDGYNLITETTLTRNAETVMSIMRPGGLRFGFGINVGL